ncbi:MAG: hypothetical protein ACTSQI_06140 [Candidatus Helarchaeota archaeon]
MTLKSKSTLRQEDRARTMYLSIPSEIVLDSQFTFQKNDVVEIIVTPNKKEMIIREVGE